MKSRLIAGACWLTLIALGLMVYSVLVPRPIPVVLAMSVGQAIGTLASLLYLAAFLLDLKSSGVLDLKKLVRKR